MQLASTARIRFAMKNPKRIAASMVVVVFGYNLSKSTWHAGATVRMTTMDVVLLAVASKASTKHALAMEAHTANAHLSQQVLPKVQRMAPLHRHQ